MVPGNELIAERMRYVEDIISRLEENKEVRVETLLRAELESLRRHCIEKKREDEDKRVVRREERGSKTRYYLNDGSVYVVKGMDYRYLYDAQSKVVTYEFSNGQIERTFKTGLKEIRHPDGTIVIKEGQLEPERIN